MKKIILFFAIIALGLLSACGGSDKELSTEHLLIGVTAGPHKEVMEKVADKAKDEGLDIELKVFTDYIIPNTALADGDLDINIYQHEPFLDQYNKDHDTNLTAVGKTILFPMGIYSDQIDSVDELEEGDKVGIPNDPTNGARALAIFQDAGLISLPDDKKYSATIRDIEDNKLDLEFIALPAEQLPKQLTELKAAAINTNYALPAGYNPKEDSIFLEPTNTPYVNYIVVREENVDDEVVQTLIDLYQSEDIEDFIAEEYEGSIIPSW